MGSLVYNTNQPIPIDDRALAHLQLVIYGKLRAHESFPFSWKDEPGVGDGHGSIWISPGVPITFKYAGSREPSVNREWLRVLRDAANQPSGLRLVPEPDGPGR
ncbi:ATP-dependent DNA ligase [Amnibacterium endophyticum]|uniref:ATP-dependent DNA ligase n=1 Tax=Amnibacterium endophyticum TaxID=2109337 RepID=A0ABW4LE92_9MICO